MAKEDALAKDASAKWRSGREASGINLGRSSQSQRLMARAIGALWRASIDTSPEQKSGGREEGARRGEEMLQERANPA